MKSVKYKIADTVTPGKLYETNYYKAMLLFPQLDNSFIPLAGSIIECHDKSLHIKVKERHKYTSEVILYKQIPENKSISQVELILRLYYDARLIEVIAFQGSKKLKKYENYPNKDMYLIDEKKQLNFHLQAILNMGLNMVANSRIKTHAI